VFLALSNKSIELSQIYSELNNLKMWNYLGIQQSSLLQDFLLRNAFDNKVDVEFSDSLIKITELDDSQKKAISLALKSRVSVITGAPGTGKTQVIENILANALIRNKKVLVASKNNKAVNNVKERFDKIDETGYLLRFGNKDYVRNHTLPYLSVSISKISELQNNASEYKQNEKEFEENDKKIKSAKAELAKIAPLYAEISQLVANIKTNEDKQQDIVTGFLRNIVAIETSNERKVREMENKYKSDIWSLNYNKKNEDDKIRENYDNKVEQIRGKYRDVRVYDEITKKSFDDVLREIEKLELKFNEKYKENIFRRLWHRLFSSASKDTKDLNSIADKCSEPLKTYLYDNKDNKTNSYTYKSLFIQIDCWKNVINNGLDFKKEIINAENDYEDKKRKVDNKYNNEKLRIENAYVDEKKKQEEQYDSDIKQINAVFNKNINPLIADCKRMQKKKKQKEKELQDIKGRKTLLEKDIDDGNKWIENNSKKMLLSCIHYYKKNNSLNSISNYMLYLPDNIPWGNGYANFEQDARNFTDLFRLCSVTSLSTKNAFPLMPELFDMVVIDEASQCDIASALPLIMRTKQLVVIGDPMQLKHISKVKNNQEDAIRKQIGIGNMPHVKYVECSLYDYCSDLISLSTNGMNHPYMLRYHYRCHNSIIDYSNKEFYSKGLGQELEIKTDLNKLKGGDPKGIVTVNVNGVVPDDGSNINQAEVVAAVMLAVCNANIYKDVSIGIITPFRLQAERINAAIPKKFSDRIEASTVHKFQGDEKDIIIYSMVVTDNSPASRIYWIEKIVPNLVNVAVTRARSRLYVVCNVNYIKNNSTGLLRNLIS
jgi:superfamily I DNA and/or RNA helicase